MFSTPQGQFLAQHNVAMLEQCWDHSKQCRNNVVIKVMLHGTIRNDDF